MYPESVNGTSGKFKILVQPAVLETAADDPIMDGGDIVRFVGAVEDPMVMVVRGGIDVGPGTRRRGTDAEGPVRVRGDVNLVQPVDVETATGDPLVDGVDMVRSEGAAGNIKQTQGSSIKHPQGSYVRDLVEELAMVRLGEIQTKTE